MITDSLRAQKIRRWGALKLERATWEKRWRDTSEFLLPFAGRFFSQDRNRGDKSFNSIYDSTGTRALRILAAGMMAGMTSPARPWFRLATSDNALMERDSVKNWLNDVAQMMRDIFARSNTYRSFHSMYEELGAFATSVNYVEPDFDSVIWNYPLTVGEYAISVDPRGRGNTLYREFEMTAANIVGQFGQKREKSGSADWSNISSAVKTAYDQSNYDAWFPVLHAVEPRDFSEREYGKAGGKHMAFRSCYLEHTGNEDKVLRESGYEDFPGQIVRWHTRGQDIYGNGPAMEALGDIKQLQHEQLRKAQGIDYMVKPPIQIPGELKGSDIDWLPGGSNYTNITGQGHIRPIFETKIDLGHLLVDIQDVRTRINQAFYADLFLMISNDQRRQPVSAREIAERHEEKLLMLGPVLERLHDEMLSPAIDNTFFRMMKAGILPPPPPEMQGNDIKVEFVSTLAQAQRAVGLSSIDRLLGTVALIAPVRPDAMDKIDVDQVIDKYADMLAVDPSVIVADDRVAIIRESRRKQQQAQAAIAAAQPLAATAKDLSQADTGGKNALTDVMKQFTGYTT